MKEFGVVGLVKEVSRSGIFPDLSAYLVNVQDTLQKYPCLFLVRLELCREQAQFFHFLDILANEEDPYKTFYALAIYTGCRRGELCALKWDDLIMNGDECVLTVSRSRSSVPGQGVVEGATKNGQARTIYISEKMTTVFRCYCYYKMYETREGGFEMSDYVFTNEYGELMHPDTFSRHLRRLHDENGFPRGFHLHTLRHYFVSTMLHNGVDKQTVAELAGHGDTGFLERTYCHPQLQLKREAAERYTQMMFDFNDRGSASA